MNGPAQRRAIDAALVMRLRQKVEVLKEELQGANEFEKPAAILRLDWAVNQLTDVLLYGKMPPEEP